MTTTEIDIGDVCIDLVKRGKVQVVDVAAETVEEHRNQNDYDIASYNANALLDVLSSEPVFTVVYLKDEPSTSYSGTYDFPASRLARQPVENANDGLRPVQDELQARLLSRLFQHAAELDEDDDTDAYQHTLEAICQEADTPASLLKEAQELAEVERQFD